MNKRNSMNLCTVCHKSFINTSNGNRMMCPGCRIQEKESDNARGHKETVIVVIERKAKIAG